MSTQTDGIMKDGISFAEQPEEYLRAIYEEAMQHNDDLRDINKENRLFYEGTDEKLETRSRDTDVQRSSLYIHEMKPAIDTRVSDGVFAVETREFPVTQRVDLDTPTEDEIKRAGQIEEIINEQLRDSGYLPYGWGDHVRASEIYRSVPAVRVSWESSSEQEAVIIEPSRLDILRATLTGRAIPQPRVKFVDKFPDGKPVVELLAPDEFLYQPDIGDFQKDSDYAGHVMWVSWSKLMGIASDQNWDKTELESMREELRSIPTDQTNTDPFEKSVKESQEDAPTIRPGFNEGKYLIVEWYLREFDESGDDVIQQVHFVANKLIVKQKKSPFKGIKFPYVLISINNFPGSLEGLSSVDITKNMQKLYNEIFNQYLDGVSYRIFPPLIMESGTTFQEKPKWAPGQLWKVTNPVGLRPLVENPGVMPDLPSLMAAVASKIRQTLNAEDISQGFQANQYEKATATSLRASGSAKRAQPTRQIWGKALVEVARMILALNQQFHEFAPLFVMPLITDVPALTGASDPEEEKRQKMLLLSQAQQNPIYRGPDGLMKLRKLTWDMTQEFVKTDVDQVVPTVEEMRSFLGAQRGVQQAQLEVENAQQEIAIAQGGNQNGS